MGNYFTIAELSKSQVAVRKGIENIPTGEVVHALEALIEKLLNPIREAWGAPIWVNSGYRSPVLNRAVGGVANSQHMQGEAADITAGSPAKNRQLFELIQMRGFTFDQLIEERNFTWLHISYKQAGCRGQVLHG